MQKKSRGKPKINPVFKLSWEATAAQMAHATDDGLWSAFENITADGIRALLNL